MLLDEYAHNCVILEKETVSDGEGGRTTQWVDGEAFINHQALDTSTEARRAEQEGVTSLYSGLIDKGVGLGYGDYFRDNITGLTYRVTSIPDEKQTPGSASFQVKYFTAERLEAPE
ncbi:MAG: hypothetical protein LUD72_10790 [Bacteroidales bacterium]|nr:hypothetical protein [Bacteroidales bacterium]